MNGKVTQRGTTRDMMFDIPFLIEYLTGFMTLSPGDVILTGTPEGLCRTCIPATKSSRKSRASARLVNTIGGDDAFSAALRIRASR